MEQKKEGFVEALKDPEFTSNLGYIIALITCSIVAILIFIVPW